MSYMTWGTDLKTVNVETIKQFAAIEYDFFEKTLKVYGTDLDTFGRWVSAGLEDDSYFENIIDNVKDTMGEDIEEEVVINTLQKAYWTLCDTFEDKTGAALSLWCPLADVENDYMDRPYWSIENYYIVNPKINKELLEKVITENVVQGS